MSLSGQQLNELERAMTWRRDKLVAELRRDAGREREDVYAALAGEAADAGDAATADLISDLDHAELSRDLHDLRELDAALERLRGRTYGRCAGCGCDIGFERLSAEPTARRCLDCQRLHERTFAHPPEPRL